MKPAIRSGIFWIVVGVLLIFASLYFEGQVSEGVRSSHNPSFIGTCIKALDVVGIALLAIGALNILLETRDWRNYFAELLREIVVEQSYLNTLDKDKLTTLQTNVLKALFRDQLIDREGSFLNYFHSNLHRYIADPYREDVSSEISITERSAELWAYTDKVTYVCRKAAGSIQKYVNWKYEPNEYEEYDTLTIEIQFPYTHVEKGKRVTLYEGKPTAGEELSVDLSNYANIDGLIVTAVEKSSVRKQDFQHWTMAHPTKNFSITITFPPDHSIQVKPLVLNPELLLVTERPGYYSAKYDSWMLPESGMAFRIKPLSS
jgi:hypothetical protein